LDFTRPFCFDSDRLKESNGSPLIQKPEKEEKGPKSKIYDPPRIVLYESKNDYKAREEHPPWMKYLVWTNQAVEKFDFRVLMIYSETNSKENKAIYVKTAEDGKRLENYFKFLLIKNSGYNFVQKISSFMIYSKILVSSIINHLIPIAARDSRLNNLMTNNIEVKAAVEPEKVVDLKLEEKERRKSFFEDITSIKEKIHKEAIMELILIWRGLALERKKEEDEKIIYDSEKNSRILNDLAENLWLHNLNNLIINERFFEKWLSAALNNMRNEKDDLKNPISFRLNFVQIETPMGNSMDLFKPMVLISGQFMPEKYITSSPSHSPLKTLFLKKNENMRKKNTFSLNSMDCFLQQKINGKLIWDISPENKKSLKSSDLEIMENIFIEFLDEGGQNNDSFQKGKSHRIIMTISLLNMIFKSLKTSIFWIPLKSVMKSPLKDQFLFLKVVNLEFNRKRNEGYFDEIYGNELILPDIKLIKIEAFLDNLLKSSYGISRERGRTIEENMVLAQEKIKEKYDELSFKNYWKLIEKFLAIFALNKDDIKALSLNGLPNIIRRKVWGMKNREKYRENLEYCLNNYLKIKKNPQIRGEIHASCIEIFKRLFLESKNHISFNLLSKIEKDLKTFIHQLSPEGMKIIGDIFQSLLFWAKLIGKKLVYSKSLLSIILNIFQTFSNDFLYSYYFEIQEIKEWFKILSEIHSDFDDLNLKDTMILTSDCFWAVISMLSEFFPDCYLIDENQKDSATFDLKGIRGAMIILRTYLQEIFPQKMHIFELNEGTPFGIELSFGELFIDLMASFGFRKESLFRLWDVMFYLEELSEKNIRCSSFIIAIISVLMRKLETLNFKNFREFRKYVDLYLISLEDFDEFIDLALQESIKINNFISKKWHIWIEIENQLVKNFNYFKNYAQMTDIFLTKSETINQNTLSMVSSPTFPLENHKISDQPKVSLHLFIYELNIYHTETTFLLDLTYNSISKLYRCNDLQKNRLVLNLYDNFPFEPSQKSLIINIFIDRATNFIDYQHSQLQTSDETLEELLLLNERSHEPIQQLLMTNPQEDRNRLFSLEIDLSGFIKGLVHKKICKLMRYEKTQAYFSSEIEIALLISESDILKESYFAKQRIHLNSNFPKQLNFISENNIFFNEILTEIYEDLEKIKHFGSLVSERAGSTFFLFEDSYDEIYMKFMDFLNRMNICEFRNEVALRWIYESLKLLSVREKRNRNNSILLPEFASSLFLLSPEKGLQFLFGNSFNEKIPILTFKLFLKYLYNFLGFYVSSHYIDNFLEFYMQNYSRSAGISKAYITIGEAQPKKNRFDIKKILIEYMICSHSSFGSKEILFGSDFQLKVLKEILNENHEFKQFSEQLINEKYAILTIKYRTADGLRSIKTIKFNNKWEIEMTQKATSLKPNENLFYNFMNSLSFNSFGIAIDYNQAQNCLKNLPLLNYFISFRRIFDNISYPYLDQLKMSKIRVEININSSLLMAMICPLETQVLKSDEKVYDYLFFASKWKHLIKYKLKELLKEEAMALEDQEEDLSEKNNNELAIEIPSISIFTSIQNFILNIQCKLLMFFESVLETKNIAFLSALNQSRALFMMDFFRTKLRVSIKHEKIYLKLSEIGSLNLANALEGKKIPVLVFEYITPNIDPEILRNSHIPSNGYFNMIYPKETLEKKFWYRDLSFFRFPDHTGEWLEAEILGGKLKEKEKKHFLMGKSNTNELKKEDFASFEVKFKKFSEEIFIKDSKDVRICSKINFSKFIS